MYKGHPKFSGITTTKMTMYSVCNQMEGKVAKVASIGYTAKSGIVANETLLKMGVDKDRQRMRWPPMLGIIGMPSCSPGMGWMRVLAVLTGLFMI